MSDTTDPAPAAEPKFDAPPLSPMPAQSPGDAARMRSKQFTVDLSEDLIAELRQLFGPERIRLVRV